MAAPPARPAGRLLHVRVRPGASRNEVVGWEGEALRVRVTAPPEGGRANRAVTALLATALDVPPASVELVRGGSARDKFFLVRGLDADSLRARLRTEPSR
ncbi:MAG: DUF167 domain-containing protein [Candidatus Rokubacteria bacterium]|nr:DUF167 domain-containing protein [Candidatus Rokubacteria bacterium]